MADRASLERLARFRERDDLDEVLAATERRLSRRRHLRQAAVPLVLVAAVVGGWSTLTTPTGHTVPEIAAGPPPAATPCPEGRDVIDRRTLAAVAAGTALLTGCTNSTDNAPTSSASDWPSWTTLDITGDLEDSTQLVGTEQGRIQVPAGDEADSIVAAWERGDLGELPVIPTVRFAPVSGAGEATDGAESGQHSLTLSWPNWMDEHDLNDASLTLRIADYTVVPQTGACQVSLAPTGTFVLQGTIDCTELRGIRAGSDERPVFNLHAELTYQMPVCAMPGTTSGVQEPGDCRPLDP